MNTSGNQFQMRDPIHGVIFISTSEREVIDSLVFQRLRNIKQVGFLDFAFPCATHSRHSHSLGTLQVASRIFERIISSERIAKQDWQRMRQVVRLSALLHDIGHSPLSHTTEMLMPPLNKLVMGASLGIKATHEDFTLKLILDSKLSEIIDSNFGSQGISAAMIASLLNKNDNNNFFIFNGLDYSPVLKQIISSEMDADRMDYLLRDSFFCGVNYGKFDFDWLVENLVCVEQENRVFLGLRARALFAFEDFLLSRYHMFASVYLHHTPVIMEKMLERFFLECPQDFILPTNIEDYIGISDLDLWQVLKNSKNSWAERIVRRRPFTKLWEGILGINGDSHNLKAYELVLDKLKNANIDFIYSQSNSVLSAYSEKRQHRLFIKEGPNNILPIDKFSPVFMRYKTPTALSRVYVNPSAFLKAKEIIKELPNASA